MDEDEDIVPSDEEDEDLEEEDDDASYVEESAAPKDSYEIVSEAERRTRPYITKYEMARLFGANASRIANNSPAMFDVTEGDTLDIALDEIKQKVVPIQIIRPLPNGKAEKWDPNKMIDLRENVTSLWDDFYKNIK